MRLADSQAGSLRRGCFLGQKEGRSKFRGLEKGKDSIRRQLRCQLSLCSSFDDELCFSLDAFFFLLLFFCCCFLQFHYDMSECEFHLFSWLVFSKLLNFVFNDSVFMLQILYPFYHIFFPIC